MSTTQVQTEIDPRNQTEDIEVEELLKASKSGNLIKIQELLRNAKNGLNSEFVNRKDEYGNCSLHHAAQFGHVHVIEHLLKCGADVNCQSKSGRSPLHWAAHHNQAEVLDVLLKSGANIDLGSKNGATPLHESIERNNFKIVKTLLKRGADFTVLNKKEMSPLYLLARKGSFECCQMLMEKTKPEKRKEMVNTLTKDGENALFAAIRCDITQCSYADEIQWKKDSVLKIIKLLIDEDIDIDCQNKVGVTPLQLAKQEASRSQEIKRPHYRAIVEFLSKVKQDRLYSELMQQPCVPAKDRLLKLYFCGQSGVGKTTLKKSLQRSSFQAWLTCRQKERAPPPGEDCQKSPTAGIHVNSVDIPTAGKFSVWDCAGQGDYFPTHSKVLGAQNALFVVQYKIAEYVDNQLRSPRHTMETQREKVMTWLRFIKSTNVTCKNTDGMASARKPTVILVASRADWVKDHRKEAETVARQLCDEAREMFKDSLNILEDVFILNCHKSQDEDMVRLRKCLKTSRDKILEGEKPLPKLCAAILKIKEKWATEKSFPVLYWKQYEKQVRETVDKLVEPNFLKAATNFLHDTGEFLYIKCKHSEDIVVLHPDWLCRDIFGPMFAVDTLYKYGHKLAKQDTYSTQELQQVLGNKSTFELLLCLLKHAELVFPVKPDKTSEIKYIIPGLLPLNMPPDQWRSSPSVKHYYGRRFQCQDETDAFSPGFFPQLQIRLLKCFDRRGIPLDGIWKNGMKVCSKVEGLVYMTKDSRAIHVCVRTIMTDGIGQCYDLLEMITWHIYDILSSSCPGADVGLYILSAQSLKDHDDLDEVSYYSFQRISEAEERKEKVFDERIGRKESISELLCPGFDRTFLYEQKENCDIAWLLKDCKEELFMLLEPQQPISFDYSMMTEYMGFDVSYLQCLKARSSTYQQMKTSLLFEDWSKNWAQLKQKENQGEVVERISQSSDSEKRKYIYYESNIKNLIAILKDMERDDALGTIENMMQTLELDPASGRKESNHTVSTECENDFQIGVC
ncbi:death-associated protein kinase 1-like [Ptychodera flava]|uniref:death-associated protein kinase 1-like n=1 Tax=Ptychodera flava TaxID=63121 RepID=UPI003969FB5D